MIARFGAWVLVGCVCVGGYKFVHGFRNPFAVLPSMPSASAVYIPGCADHAEKCK